MRRKLREKKRLIAAIIAAILAAVMILSVAAPLLSVYGADGGVVIDGTMGFNRIYKLNGSTPFNIQLTNNGPHFKGELQIKLNVSGDTYMSMYNTYSYPVELPTGSSKSLEMEMIIPVVRTEYKAVLLDEKGNQVAEKIMPCTPVQPYSVLVGALTGDANGLAYLRNMNVTDYYGNNKYLGNELITLDENSFPDTETAMRNFDMIIINDFDTDRLSEASRSALASWVRGGGLLALGTGQNYNKVFKGLGNSVAEVTEISSGTMGRLEFISDSGALLFYDSPPYLSRMDIPGAETVWEADGHMLAAIVRKELGAVILHSYDMATSPFPEIFAGDGGAVINSVYTSELDKKVKSKSINMNNNNNGAIYLLTNLPSLNNGTIAVIFIIILVYALFIGPVLYLLLKKKDIRERGFVIVPIIAVTVTLALYLAGSGTSYRRPIVNTISKLTLESQSTVVRAEINAGVFSPKKGNVDVAFNKDMSVSIINDTYYNRSRYYSSYSYVSIPDQEVEIDLAKITYGATPSLTFYDKASWDTSIFSSSATIDMEGVVEGYFYPEGTELKGWLRNNTRFDLDDVLVMFGDNIERYPGLASGETLEISQAIALPVPTAAGSSSSTGSYYSSYYNRLSEAFGMQSGITGGMNREEYRQNYYKYSIMNHYVSNNRDIAAKMQAGMTMYSTYTISLSSSAVATTPPRATSAVNAGTASGSGSTYQYDWNPWEINVFAFNSDKMLQSDIYVDKKTPNEFHTNLLELKFPISFDKSGSSIELPFGFIRPDIISSDTSFNCYYPTVNLSAPGIVEFSYKMPEGVDVGAFCFEWFDKYYSYAGASLNIALEIYNTASGKWETLSRDEYDSGVYINVYGRITVRIKMTEAGNTNMPEIKITGKSVGVGD